MSCFRSGSAIRIDEEGKTVLQDLNRRPQALRVWRQQDIAQKNGNLRDGGSVKRSGLAANRMSDVTGIQPSARSDVTADYQKLVLDGGLIVETKLFKGRLGPGEEGFFLGRKSVSRGIG